MIIIQILLPIIAYLVGAIPTGYLFSRCFADIDITKHGSGNPGATNVARVLGITYFFPVFTIDAGKAFLMLWLGAYMGALSEATLLACAAGLIIGNSFSLFQSLQGGKAVATSFGIALYFLPSVAVFVAALIWGIVAILTRHAFWGSLSAFFLITLYCFWAYGLNLFSCFFAAVLLWIVIRHKQNLVTVFK